MNEVQVSLDDVGRVQLRHAGEGSGVYTLETTEALREYFQAERDIELGRWRDPENPDLVCYPDEMSPNWVLVIQESTGDTDTVFRHTWGSTEDDEFILVADRYFAAHPEPKPCDAAQPDEIWVLTINNDTEEVFRCGERGLYSLKTGNPLGSLLSCGSNKITAGHRVWPGEYK